MNNDKELKIFIRVPMFLFVFQMSALLIYFFSIITKGPYDISKILLIIFYVLIFCIYIFLVILLNKYGGKGYIINGEGILYKNVFIKKYFKWEYIIRNCIENKGKIHILKFHAERSIKNKIYKYELKIIPVRFGIHIDELVKKINAIRGYEYITRV
jgi:hypothetical protein